MWVGGCYPDCSCGIAYSTNHVLFQRNMWRCPDKQFSILEPLPHNHIVPYRAWGYRFESDQGLHPIVINIKLLLRILKDTHREHPNPNDNNILRGGLIVY